MSCHDIGHGMNSVSKVVIGMYNTGEINYEAAFKLFHALRKGVNWCDGNEYEAVECLDSVYCGCCLKKFDENEEIVNLFNLPDEIKEKYEEKFKPSGRIEYTIYDKLKDKIVCEKVCKTCRDKLFGMLDNSL